MEGRDQRIKNLMDHFQMCHGGGKSARAGRRGSASNEDRVEWPGRTSGARTLILISHTSCTSSTDSPWLCQEHLIPRLVESVKRFHTDRTLSAFHQRGTAKAYESLWSKETQRKIKGTSNHFKAYASQPAKESSSNLSLHLEQCLL